MDLDFTMDYITYALEKEEEKMLWDMFLAEIPRMTESVTFKEYKEARVKTVTKYTNKSDEEIIDEFSVMIENDRKKVKHGDIQTLR